MRFELLQPASPNPQHPPGPPTRRQSAQSTPVQSPASAETNSQPPSRSLPTRHGCPRLFLHPLQSSSPPARQPTQPHFYSLFPAPSALRPGRVNPAQPSPPPPVRSADTASPAAHISPAPRPHHADRSPRSAPPPAAHPPAANSPDTASAKTHTVPPPPSGSWHHADPAPAPPAAPPPHSRSQERAHPPAHHGTQRETHPSPAHSLPASASPPGSHP